MRIMQLLWLSSCVGHAVAHAEQAVIDNSGQSDHGVLALNQAAGSANQQGNLQAVAVSTSASHANVFLPQQQSASTTAAMTDAHASITGAAFSGSQGLMAINQTAGNANQSLNTFSLAASPRPQVTTLPSVAADSLLTDTAGSSPAVAASSSSHAQTDISAAAFQGSRGLVQLNQIAGSHNQAVNVVAVQWANP
ncbi:hypothetical protein [Aquitalea denitrificans]|uniref:hypothetical protein n=1 Tax=Aquitalea denitrificans TaxID=519081 RepID=UPI0013576607|nr:hypothetical protein [Aquitalea denitrificans]